MKNKFCFFLGFFLVLMLLSTISLSACSMEKETTEASPAGITEESPGEEINVHGHWIIEVRNPDGSLVEIREFDNALDSNTGRAFLVGLLGRQISTGGWYIILRSYSTPPEHPFLDGSSKRVEGFISESTDPGVGPFIFKNLSISTPSSGEHAGSLLLSGTATAQIDGNIGGVITMVHGLDATMAPSSNYGGSFYLFTHTILDSAVSLIAGQQVVVTVAISFS